MIVYYAQVFLGRYIHRRRAQNLVPADKPHPPSNILHVVLGLTTIGLAFFQVCLILLYPLSNGLHLSHHRYVVAWMSGRMQLGALQFFHGVMIYGLLGSWYIYLQEQKQIYTNVLHIRSSHLLIFPDLCSYLANSNKSGKEWISVPRIILPSPTALYLL